MRLVLYALLFVILFLSAYVVLFGRDKTNKLLESIFFIVVVVALIYFVIFIMAV